MALGCVCADVKVSGSRSLNGTRNTRRGRRSTGGAFYWAAQNVLMLAYCCFKLVALIVICKVKNHILERNSARWHYNTLRL